MNNAIEQFDDMYSFWSALDRAGKEAWLMSRWMNLQSVYQALVLSYSSKGYFNEDEARLFGQLQQMLQGISVTKLKADQDLYNEMMTHLAKMAVKHQNR